MPMIECHKKGGKVLTRNQCDGCGKVGKPVGDASKNPWSVPLPAGWKVVLSHCRTPTGRKTMRSSWDVLSVCTTCKKDAPLLKKIDDGWRRGA